VSLLAVTLRAVELPHGFIAETLATDLNAATALAITPDGRVFIADQTGPVRVCKDGRLLAEPALDLTGRLDDFWERGLLGLAFHPDFPATPFLYTLYVARQPHTHHVLSRFIVIGDTVDAASEQVLLEGDDQAKMGGKQPGGHQGGPLRFGPDGKLYIGLGEQTAGQAAQRLDTLIGKILRINADGSIPADNPFYHKTTGKYRAIWAYGIRNPFGMVFEPGTGRLFETEVGQTSFEEINIIEKGANYGWPASEGPTDNPAFTSPIHSYAPVVGRSIVGAAFGEGKLFFADWAANWLKTLDPAKPGEAVTFAKNLDGPVALDFAQDGSLLVLNRATIWRDGKKWKPDSGSLIRIRRLSDGETLTAAPARPPLPDVLDAQRMFSALHLTEERADFVEFEINHAPWTPGVVTRRWLSLPPGGRLEVNAEGEFTFPKGAIVMQQHSVQKTGKPFETHLHWFTGPRSARAAAYRWNEEGTQATRVSDCAVIPLPGDPQHQWFTPGLEENLNLDHVIFGFLLPINPRQIYRGEQLAQWSARGWLEQTRDAVGMPRLAALEDASASPELRVRSYLDVNCAACHRPGGPSRGTFDARFLTPLAEQNLLAGGLLAGDLGIADARLIVPGHPQRSILLQRLVRTDAMRMPPTAVNALPAPVASLLKDWIQSLPPQTP
jgi:glucose/arabinose dehydrogenase